MIIGRLLASEDMDQVYDYLGVLYPVGMTAEDDHYFFNRDAIAEVYHVGYIDDDEIAFKEEVLSELGELEIEDGEIVPKA